MVTTGSLDWLQTLADNTRVRLLRLLHGNELSVSELCAVVQLPQSTVSRHLRVLAADGWVANRKNGTNHLYRIDASAWCDSRTQLWQWVHGQADSHSLRHDSERLQQVLAQRSLSERFFSNSAEQWDRLRVELFGKQIDAFVLAASLNSDKRVGELGCGSAPLCKLVAPYVAEAVGVDNSEAMLAQAKQRLASDGKLPTNIRLMQAELTSTPLPNDCLDIAWMVLVLPYIDEPQAVLQEASRVLKRGSRLVIVDLLPHDREEYQQEMGHVRLGTSRDLLDEWMTGTDLQLQNHIALPPDPEVRGPALFAAIAHKS